MTTSSDSNSPDSANPAESLDDSQRLNKFLAFHLGSSRRESDNLIARGDVTVNGEQAVLGGRVKPTDKVAVKGKALSQKMDFTYLTLHKPRGYVCSRRQQGETPTIYSLLATKYHNLKPVGRLDADSSGLLLLSDDGDFTYNMTHPKFYKTKIYMVQLNTPLAPLHQQMISDFGVDLEDGKSKLTVEKADGNKWPDDFTDQPVYQITMHEGRNRQIRRTFAALGYKVTSLHRIKFGDYHLHDMKNGSYQEFAPNL